MSSVTHIDDDTVVINYDDREPKTITRPGEFKDFQLLNLADLWYSANGKYGTLHFPDNSVDFITNQATHRFVHKSIIYEYDEGDLLSYNIATGNIGCARKNINIKTTGFGQVHIVINESFIFIMPMDRQIMVLKKYSYDIIKTIEFAKNHITINDSMIYLYREHEILV